MAALNPIKKETEDELVNELAFEILGYDVDGHVLHHSQEDWFAARALAREELIRRGVILERY